MKKKLAIVYDWLDSWGGVERVLQTLHELFPNAPFYTSYYNSKKAGWADSYEIRASFIQKMPDFIKKNRIRSIPFYPLAFESFDFSGYDVVISVTSSFAKGIITLPHTQHICYLLTPARFLWTHQSDYCSGPLMKKIASPMLNHLKKWDLAAAQRPDRIVSISKTVQTRCRKYYNRESEVIYPAFDISYWENIKKQETRNKKQTNFKKSIEQNKSYLIVSRLESYKKVDLVIETFNSLPKKNLIIVGSGTQEKKLKKMANSNIKFISSVSDRQLADLYSKASGLIMPQEEDFGMVSLEAQFFGCPVITCRKGGAVETIIENKTGLFFNAQNIKSLTETIRKYDKIKNQLQLKAKKFGKANCENFSKNKFATQIDKLIIDK